MFHASIIILGHQIRTSLRPRIMSSMKNVRRPTCDAPSRTQRPVIWRMSSVVESAICPLSCPPMASKSTPPLHGAQNAGPRARRPRALRHAAEFRRRLLRWFRQHGRDLPWRRTRDPYHVLVSEFMLQQTQVSRVEAYYHRFLERYPTVEA